MAAPSTRKFSITLTVGVAAEDLVRVRTECLQMHPHLADLPDDEIDAANINGVLCGALGGLAQAGGEACPDLCDGAEGALMAVTNSNTRVFTSYEVKELSCERS